jgi:CubicO group peptidase (beta-lactamase class C family)
LTRIGAAVLGLMGVLAIAASSTVAAATPVDDAGSRHQLTKSDVDAWLDGFVPYALHRDSIAGGVVVVVKDGKVLTERGFGYADVAARKPVDPLNSLFRPGSISKLFTWTAVMQLVEQGKVDLDADVNTYLDFKIPPYHGRRITMRDLMTHTPGFGDVFKDGDRSTGRVPPLSIVMKRMLPARIYSPGTTPAYSNYGASLAGYIVERVSGIPFDTYVQRNIFQPLGMAHSTFSQPLPPNLLPLMAKGYQTDLGEAKPFELIAVPPAGGATISGDDMAKFMIADLNQGAGLMRPETARLLFAPIHVVLPGLNRMALGYYEQQVNGLSAIAHGGDLKYFHSYMWILPSQNIGMFFSMNSAGEGDKNFAIRVSLFQSFADRYFPVDDRAPVELATARTDAKLLVGHYDESRGAFTNFLDFGNFLGQTGVGLDKDARPLVPDFLGGAPRKWIEVAPLQWRDAYGSQRLSAKVENGKVVRWSVDAVAPFMVWVRAPWYRNTAWLMPAFIFGGGIIAITALAWPAGAIVRWRYGASLSLSGADLIMHRLLPVFAWLASAALGGWMLLFSTLEGSEANLDLWIWLLEFTSVIGFVGLAVCAFLSACRAWTPQGNWAGRIWSSLRAAGALSVLWVAVAFHLISFGTNY